MFDQNNNYGMGMQQGYQFNGAQNGQLPKVPNVLSEAEIKELQQQRSVFTLGLTKKEMLQGICNHRTADGMNDTLVYDNATGLATCTICGYTFRPIEPDVSYDSIKDSTDRIIDILQTIKILYTDLPAESAKEYFQIIPLIAKVPQLFEFAAKNFAKHEYNMWSYQGSNMGGMAMLQNLSNMFGGMNMGQPMMNQPQFNGYATTPQQPVGYPNGMGTGQPMMNQPQMGANPFGYPGASAGNPALNTGANPAMSGGYVPQSQGFAYNPGAAQAAPVAEAPKAPVADDTVKQTVTV